MDSALITFIELTFEDEFTRSQFIADMSNRNNTLLSSVVEKEEMGDLSCMEVIWSQLFEVKIDMVNSPCYTKRIAYTTVT